MIIFYYNENGLNLIKDSETYTFPYFKGSYLNLYNNDLIFDTLIIDKQNFIAQNEFFKFNKKYNFFSLDLDFPYLKSCIYKNLYYYNFPKYYSPSFDYDYNELENKYYLGVYQTIKCISTGEDIPFTNFVVFLSDKNTGEIVWYWEMYQYFIDNNMPLNWSRRIDNPVVHSLSRVGKNNLGLDENDVMFTISKLNQILFVKPFENIVDKVVNLSDITKKNIGNFIDAHIIPEGLQGEGNLLFLNNNNESLLPSEIVEYDLLNNEIIFEWGDEKIRNTNLGGSVQKLPNGNYFIYCYTQNKVLEISTSKEILNEIIISDTTEQEKKEDPYQIRDCYVVRQIPDEWASNFIDNYELIESTIKNYK